MKFFLILALSCLAASAFVAGASRFASTGTSKQFRTEDNLGNFNFGYDESHNTGATSRREESANGVRRGMYSLYDADGRQRIVNYVADEDGFRAHVQTNEPGYAPKDSADVIVNKDSKQQYSASASEAPAYSAPRATYSDAPAKGYSAPAPAKSYSSPAPVKSYDVPAPVRSYASPAPAPIKSYSSPAPVKSYSLPAPAPVKSYSAPAPAKGYSVPVVQAPVYQEPVYEEPEAVPEPTGPWSFSYSFDSTHAAPVKTYEAPSPVKSYATPAPVKSYAAPAPAPVKSYVVPAAPAQLEQEQEQVQEQVHEHEQVQQQEEQQQQHQHQQQDQQSSDF